MRLTRVALRVAGVPLLSGCMMLGGMGHTGAVLGIPRPVEEDIGWLTVPFQHAEASSAGLTLSLSIAEARSAATVAIGASLRADGAPGGVADGEVRLRIQPPGGTVDLIPMRRGSPAAAGTYHAEYRFPTSGFYLLTAEGRMATEGGVRTVLVTAEIEVGRGARGTRQDWVLPVGILSSLGMVTMMTFK